MKKQIQGKGKKPIFSNSKIMDSKSNNLINVPKDLHVKIQTELQVNQDLDELRKKKRHVGSSAISTVSDHHYQLMIISEEPELEDGGSITKTTIIKQKA